MYWLLHNKMFPHCQVSRPYSVANMTSELTIIKRYHKIVIFKETEKYFAKKYIFSEKARVCVCVCVLDQIQKQKCSTNWNLLRLVYWNDTNESILTTLSPHSFRRWLLLALFHIYQAPTGATCHNRQGRERGRKAPSVHGMRVRGIQCGKNVLKVVCQKV